MGGEAPERPEQIREVIGIHLRTDTARPHVRRAAGPRLGALIGLTHRVNWYLPISLLKLYCLSGARPTTPDTPIRYCGPQAARYRW